MVTSRPHQKFTVDRPMPVTTVTTPTGPPVVAAQDQDALLDVLERIQQQLGQINNHNNLAPGERFE